MSAKTHNVWKNLRSGVGDNPIAIYFFLVGIGTLVLGLIFFYRDLQTSFYGWQLYNTAFDLSPDADYLYWALSLAPSVGFIGFMVVYSLDTERYRWFGIGGVFWFLLDIMSDLVFVANGHFLQVNMTTGQVERFELSVRTLAALVKTLVLTQIASEGFISVGIILTAALLPLALRQWTTLRVETGNERRKAKPKRNTAPQAKPKRNTAPQSGQKRNTVPPFPGMPQVNFTQHTKGGNNV